MWMWIFCGVGLVVGCRRCCSSCAARLVKVIARRRDGGMLCCEMRLRSQCVRVRVFPDPGPARMSRGLSMTDSADCCTVSSCCVVVVFWLLFVVLFGMGIGGM